MLRLTKRFSDFSKGIVLIFVLLLFLMLPQINISGYVQPTVISKFVYFQYSCLVLLSLYSLTIIFTKKTSFSFSKLDVILFILLSYIALNRYVIQTNFGFSIRYLELVGLSFLYIVLRNTSFKNYVWLLLIVVASGVIQAIYGNLQLLGYYPSNHSGFRMTGSFFNPGPYAGFLSAVWPITLDMYLFKEIIIEQVQPKSNSIYLNNIFQYILNYIPLLGVISILLVIPASQSRASWLAVFISSCLLLEYRYKVIITFFNNLTRLKKTLLIVGSILIIGVSLFGVYSLKKGSSDGRLFIWKVSTEIIKENPVFGVGFDRFRAHYMNSQANYFSKNGETKDALVADNTYYAFNEFIQFIVENGILGFIILIAVLYFVIKISAKKENRSLSIVIKISLMSLGVFAFFSYPMEILPIKLIIVLLLASMAKIDQNKLKLLQKVSVKFYLPIIKFTTIVGVFVITIYGLNYINRLNTSFKNWKLALNSYQYGDYESAMQEYEEAYPYLKNNGEFLMNYGKALSIYKQDSKAIKILEQAKLYLNTTIIETALGDTYKNSKQYKEAEIAYKKAANMIPTRFYPLYLLVKLYDESEQKEKAVSMAKKILGKDIKVPSNAIREMKSEMKILVNSKN